MQVPFRYLLGLVCGLALCIAVFVALLYTQLGIKTLSSSWASDITEKKLALREKAKGPCLLLVGGSATTFGMSAEEIQKQTGYPTLNMAVHAGLGVQYLMHWTRKVAKPGDTVLLVIEYQIYEPHSGEGYVDYALARDPEFFRGLSLWDKINMATQVPFKRIQKGFSIKRKPEPTPRPHPPYTDGASFISDFGDETGNAKADTPKDSPNRDINVPQLETDPITSSGGEAFDEIRDFVVWAKKNNIRVLATFPNVIHRPGYDGPVAGQTIATLKKFYDSIGVPVIGTGRDTMMPYADFFDTMYHLNREAAVERTDRFIPLLKPYLQQPASGK